MAVGSEDVGEEGNGLWAIGANMDEEEVDMEQSMVDGVDGREYSLTFLVSEPMTTGEGGGTEPQLDLRPVTLGGLFFCRPRRLAVCLFVVSSTPELDGC